MLYDHLEIELLDKVTHERSLKDKIKTLIANKVTGMDEDNRPEHGRPARVVALRRKVAADMALLDFIWQTLRDGIFAVVMG